MVPPTRAEAVGQRGQFGNPRDCKDYRRLLLVGVGKWDLARAQFDSVRQIAQRLGDRRRLDDAIGNLAELESLRGSFDIAATLAGELGDQCHCAE